MEVTDLITDGSSGDTDPRAANCSPSNERLFMEFNNVRALVETGGSMWQDRANSRMHLMRCQKVQINS